MSPRYISPERMAEIYWNRAGRRSLGEVAALIKNYFTNPPTLAYWRDVELVLRRKTKRGGINE